MLELAHVYSISIIIFTTPIDNKRNIWHLKRKNNYFSLAHLCNRIKYHLAFAFMTRKNAKMSNFLTENLDFLCHLSIFWAENSHDSKPSRPLTLPNYPLHHSQTTLEHCVVFFCLLEKKMAFSDSWSWKLEGGGVMIKTPPKFSYFFRNFLRK